MKSALLALVVLSSFAAQAKLAIPLQICAPAGYYNRISGERTADARKVDVVRDNCKANQVAQEVVVENVSFSENERFSLVLAMSQPSRFSSLERAPDQLVIFETLAQAQEAKRTLESGRVSRLIIDPRAYNLLSEDLSTYSSDQQFNLMRGERIKSSDMLVVFKNK